MPDDHDGFFRSRSGVVFLGFAAVAGYFLVTEHWAHIVPYLPFLLVLACPLMHLFHHGHGGHGGDESSKHGHTKGQP